MSLPGIIYIRACLHEKWSLKYTDHHHTATAKKACRRRRYSPRGMPTSVRCTHGQSQAQGGNHVADAPLFYEIVFQMKRARNTARHDGHTNLKPTPDTHHPWATRRLPRLFCYPPQPNATAYICTKPITCIICLHTKLVFSSLLCLCVCVALCHKIPFVRNSTIPLLRRVGLSTPVKISLLLSGYPVLSVIRVNTLWW